MKSDSEIIQRLVDDVYIGSTIWEKKYPPTRSYTIYQNTYYIKNDLDEKIFVEYSIYYFQDRGGEYSPTLSIKLLKGKKGIFIKSIITKEVYKLIDIIEELENYYEA